MSAVPGVTGVVPRVPVGPFAVADLDREALVGHVADLAATCPARQAPVLSFALHVGGLNARRDGAFVEAMAAADVVYADGGSVVLLARLAGAARIQRAPTTDMGWDVLRALVARLGRTPRVGLVGGPAGLAERAGRVLRDAGVAEVVLVEHGYHDDWQPVLSRLTDAGVDVLVVGLGAPAEMVWVHRHLEQLPRCLVLTCGGWFGHMVEDERRAPRLLRHSGLEWIARVAQAPRRLGPRYAMGVVSTAVLGMVAVDGRVSGALRLGTSRHRPLGPGAS